MFFGDGLGPSIADALVEANPNVKLVLRGFGQNGLKAIEGGKVLGTVDRNPFDEEFWGFMPLYFAVNGNYRAPDTMIVPTITVTKENVAGFIKDPYHNVGVDYSVRA
jgi:ABC-type sugar transport system substrate-binding protein